MSRRPKIALEIPDLKDASSFYRGMGPLSYWQKEEGVDLVFLSEYNWATCALVDCVFMQRPYSAKHVEIAKAARSFGTPIWIDYDDDLFSVPPENPAWEIYATQEVQENLRTLLSLATGFTVSTQTLLEKIASFNTRYISCIPNAFDPRLMTYPGRAETRERKKTIVWRGGPSHASDLLHFKDAILELHREFPDWHWQFWGYLPWFITEKMKPGSYFFNPMRDIMAYHRDLSRTDASILMVPLRDSPLNQSKSNIAWIEGSFGGLACIAPDFKSWREIGGARYVDGKPEAFQSVMSHFMHQPMEERAILARGSFEWIKASLSLRQTTDQRYNFLTGYLL